MGATGLPELLNERKDSVCYQESYKGIKCDSESVAGSVSQRACVYCGARVVLNPITDAYHIVHGPIGCASYTWDIRGSLSSGEEVYRNSFSTDLQEKDIIFGGEKVLAKAIDEIVRKHAPKLIFVYSTCIVGVIGDDVEAVCADAEKRHSIRVIPVKAPGFAGHKSMGYKAACDALMKLIGQKKITRKGINILGDFNLAGEMWIINNYLRSIGVNVISKITGDATYEELLHASEASLNIVQCAGSMTYLAKQMEEQLGIPYIKVSFFGIEDTVNSLMRVADSMDSPDIVNRARAFTEKEKNATAKQLAKYQEALKGKKAAIYVGGGFKAISLIRQFAQLGVQTVMVGTQTGKKDEYEVIRQIVQPDTVILDDANPYELEQFIQHKGADILVGGVKERPLAYKLGIAFCDHNHERKHPLAGFEGAINFAKEINLSINNPVWKYVGREGA